MRLMRNSRSYYVLPKGSWTSLLAELFWEHVKLPCCIAFNRAKEFDQGNSYITVQGKCSTCGSIFKGTVPEKSSGNSK